MFLSIITINRNNAKGLKKTLESVASQTCRDFEHIIIDGASTDGSVDVIKEYVASPAGKNVSYWVSEPDSGIYNAMNKGIKKATGDFIEILNSGDSFTADVLAELIPIAKQNPDKILYGAVNDIKNGIFEKVEGRSAELLPRNMIAHQTCFVPRYIYENYGLYDETLSITSDYDLFLKFYTNHVPFYYTNKIIVDYDCTGISSTNIDKVIKENDIIRKRYGFYVPPSKKEIFYRFIYKIYKSIKGICRKIG